MGEHSEKYVHSAHGEHTFAPPSTMQPSEVITWKNAHPSRDAHSVAHACSSTARGLARSRARWPSSSCRSPASESHAMPARGSSPGRGGLVIAGHAASAAMASGAIIFCARRGVERVSLAPLPHAARLPRAPKSASRAAPHLRCAS